jgi:hypothetical protein
VLVPIVLAGVAAVAVLLLLSGDQSLLPAAFVILGGILTVLTQITLEIQKRQYLVRDLARSLYVELANRIARCVFDIEKPWEQWIESDRANDRSMEVQRLQRFIPIEPTIYPATASQLALLPGTAPQTIIRFYIRFEILRLTMQQVADYCRDRNLSYALAADVFAIADRFKRTLHPGLEALRALTPLVDDHEQVDRDAMHDLDRLGFRHAREHLTLRKRLEHYTG